jgi:hypothetical protein
VIYDLDAGRPERPGGSSVRMTAITVVAVGAVLVFFTALAFAPGRRESQTPIYTFSAPPLPTLARPTFITRPVPDHTLVFPDDIAEGSFRISHEGYTGLLYNNYGVAKTYRLRLTGDLVTIAALQPTNTIPFPSPALGDVPVRVRGRAANWITANGATSIRWLENDVVFEMSSRTLSVAQLADLATTLR